MGYYRRYERELSYLKQTVKKGKKGVSMKYGDKRDYRKIDIYFEGRYICSTTWSKDCKEAKDKFVELYPQYDSLSIKCFYSEK